MWGLSGWLGGQWRLGSVGLTHTELDSGGEGAGHHCITHVEMVQAVTSTLCVFFILVKKLPLE